VAVEAFLSCWKMAVEAAVSRNCSMVAAEEEVFPNYLMEVVAGAAFQNWMMEGAAVEASRSYSTAVEVAVEEAYRRNSYLFFFPNAVVESVSHPTSRVRSNTRNQKSIRAVKSLLWCVVAMTLVT
jgi:hypothetical protein